MKNLIILTQLVVVLLLIIRVIHPRCDLQPSLEDQPTSYANWEIYR